ncbi:MAG: 2'-5' RNA ligase family protein [Candidatus Pacearchaeota archaeon]|jgi:2'-5' RNA ligase
MKEQAIVIFIPNNKEINKIRKKYDKYYKKFKNHITLSYPFKIGNQKILNEHIENSIKSIKSFKIVLKELKKSKKDYYLYLLIKKGNKNILKLYKNLHSKLLTKFKNKDMPKYIPHLTLGSFKTNLDINNAIKQIKYQNLSIKTKINEICLLTFKKGPEIENIKRFNLK